MRSIWKGQIAFGLVTIPVRLYAATEDHDVTLHQVHDKDGGRIRYQRRCEVCGRVVDYEHIDRAYEEGDRTIILTEDELSTLPEERSREIEVLEFVPSAQIDPIMFDRSYFLEPDAQSVKAYTLLRRALEKTDRTAVVFFSLRRKSRLGALRVRDKVLMLQSLLWDDEVREADFEVLGSSVRVSAKEMEMASSLVDSLASDFSPENFSDEYQEQLRTLIDAKLKRGEDVDTAATFGEEEEEGGEVIDLMDALRASVEKNRGTSTRTNTKSTSTKSTGAKSTGAKSTRTKSTGAKSTGTKSTGTKSKSAKTKSAKTKSAKSTDGKPKRAKSA